MGKDMFGFDQLEAKMQDILDSTPKLKDEFVSQQAELLIGRVKDNTPVAAENGGTLRNGWHRTTAKQGNATVYNNTEYAAHVEYGHRIKRKDGSWAKDATGKTRFVPGAKMLHKGLAETEKQFKADAETIMEKLLK